MGNDSDPDIGQDFRSVVARMMQVARQRHLSSSDCDDCVQEALIAWWMQHPGWTPDQPLTTRWLDAVVINHARLYHRRLQRRRTQTANLDWVPSHNASPEVKEEGDQDERRQSLLSVAGIALSRLSELNRRIFIQRVLDCRTYNEIGKDLGLSAERVRLRYYRTLKTLKRECKQPGMNDGGGGRGRRTLLVSIMLLAG